MRQIEASGEACLLASEAMQRQILRLSSGVRYRRQLTKGAEQQLHAASLEVVQAEDEERARPPLEFAGTFCSERWIAKYDSSEYGDYYYEDTVRAFLFLM